MSMSGISVSDEVVNQFQAIKLEKKLSYIQMKISDDKKVIEMEKSVPVDITSYEEFVSQLPANDCRYAVYDFDYQLGDAGSRSDLILFSWYV